jgi:1,5-anhydro-D-fructose reductase (1,5-anhydro-D-mannitol-forming)
LSDIGWGFIGASTWARRYLVPAVRATPGAEPVAVFSTSGERGRRFAWDCGLRRSHTSLEALLEDPELDVVYVSTTNDLHATQVIAAAAAGKHILCEKPLAIDLDDAGKMLEACAAAGVVLATNHHLRGAPTILAMRRLIEDGSIGELVAARVFFSSSLPVEFRTWRLDRPEAGAGVILDLTVHSADTIRFLLQDDVVEVTALTASGELGKGLVEDSVMGVMRMSRGPLVCFHDSFTVGHAGNGVEVHGTTGSLIAHDVLMPEPVGEVSLRRGEEISQVQIHRRWPLYEHAVNKFMSAVRGEGDVLTSGEDGFASLATALAVRESAERRCAVRVLRRRANA